MKSPEVSIVLAAHNASEYIDAAIRSVLFQTFPNWELLIVDDGSMDATLHKAHVAARDDERIRLMTQPHRGVAAARNLALESARGRYIAFLDADDIWLPNKLEIQRRCFGRIGKDLALVSSDYYLIKGVSWPLCPITIVNEGKRNYTHSSNAFFRLLLYNHLRTPVIMIRASVIEQVGMFDESLKTAEDWDMWLRIVPHGGITNVSQPLACIRVRENSLSRNEECLAIGKLLVTRKYILDPSIPDSIREKCLWNRYKDLALVAFRAQRYLETAWWYGNMIRIRPLAFDNLRTPLRYVFRTLIYRHTDQSSNMLHSDMIPSHVHAVQRAIQPWNS